MPKNPITVEYKYRTTDGNIVVRTETATRGDKFDIIQRIKKRHQYSMTPLVEIDGQKMDILPFLIEQKMQAEAEAKRWSEMVQKIEIEIKNHLNDRITLSRE